MKTSGSTWRGVLAVFALMVGLLSIGLALKLGGNQLLTISGAIWLGIAAVSARSRSKLLRRAKTS